MEGAALVGITEVLPAREMSSAPSRWLGAA